MSGSEHIIYQIELLMVSFYYSSNARFLADMLFFCYYFIILIMIIPCATSLSFNYTSFHTNGGDIVMQGDASISSGGHIELTRNHIDESPLNSSGRAIYPYLLPLWDKASGKVADFTTHFTFIVNSLNTTPHADGMTFFLAHKDLPNVDEAKGGGLGLLRADQILNSTTFPFLSVEFDTFSNDFDPNYEHVGIDINSLKSSAQVGWCNSVMAGRENEAWISYDSASNYLSVAFSGYCNNSNSRFRKYFDYEVDLPSILPENVAFGFSAATGICFELHTIQSWYFNSTLYIAPTPTPNPNPNPNPSPSSHPPTPAPGSRVNYMGLILGMLVAVLLVLGFIIWCFLGRNKKKTSTSKSINTSTGLDNTNGNIRDGDLQQARDGQVNASTEPNYNRNNDQSRDEEVRDGQMEEGGPSNRNHEDEEQFDASMDDDFKNSTGPKKYSYDELAQATSDFNEEEKLGGGAFGDVYKGKLGELHVAVKRVSQGSRQGLKEYTSEVKIISQAIHKNLVKLIGWCHERGKLLLVYEFMPNGSLHDHLYNNMLSFELRYNIVVGLAEALLYLHEELTQYVLHRDIKSSNVLLDSSFSPKLGDFGLARLVDREKWLHTTALAGTLGYMAPECSTTGKASKESDVYSFGVVALEVACGRKPLDRDAEPSERVLLHWVWELYGRGEIAGAADRRLGREFGEEKMIRLLMVGLWCANPDDSSRPSIKEAILVLIDETRKLPDLPTKMPTPTY